MSHEHRSFLHRHLILILAVALVTVIAVALFSPPPRRPQARPQVAALALTSSGDAREVALSPDGGRIAYLVDGGTTLVVRELPEGAAVDLARSAVRLGPPRWSPDGSTLLYACPLPRALCNVSTSGGGIDTIAVTTGVGVTAYGFAPDGAYVIATAVGPWIYRGSRPASLTLVGEDAVAAEGDVIDLRGVVEWVIGVAVAPDGSDIAYRGIDHDGQGVIALVTAGESRHRIVERDLREGYNLGSATSGHLAWSENRLLHYTRFVAGGRTITRVPADDRRTEPLDLIGDLPGNLSFDVSPDGAVLVYAGDARRRRLYLFGESGRAAGVPLSPGDPTWSYGSPAISPGGDVLAYIGTSPTGVSDVFVRPLAGGTERQVTFDRRPKRALSWSPEGDRLAYLSETGSGPWLMTVDTVSERLRRLGEEPAHPYGQPTWSPDGRRVLYRLLNGAGHVMVDAETGRSVTAVPSTGERQLYAVFSPDGQRIAAARWGPDGSGIWIIELEGGAAIRLTTGRDRPLLWAADDNLYFMREQLPYRGSHVLRQPVTEGSATSMFLLPFPCDVPEVAISWDARYVVCSVDEFQSDVWIVDAPDRR